MGTRLFVIGDLWSYWIRGLNLKHVNTLGMTEPKFPMTAYDLFHNLIGLRKARRAETLARIGYPLDRNISQPRVSDSDQPTSRKRNESKPSVLEVGTAETIFKHLGFIVQEFCLCGHTGIADISFPGAWLEFPYMLENLPEWNMFGATGFRSRVSLDTL